MPLIQPYASILYLFFLCIYEPKRKIIFYILQYIEIAHNDTSCSYIYMTKIEGPGKKNPRYFLHAKLYQQPIFPCPSDVIIYDFYCILHSNLYARSR